MKTIEYLQQMDSDDLAKTFIVSTCTCIMCNHRPKDILQSVSCKACVRKWLEQNDESTVDENELSHSSASSSKHLLKLKALIFEVRDFVKNMFKGGQK